MPKPNLRAVNKGDLISCSRCGGAGKIELTGVFAETLTLLRAQSAALSGVEMAQLANVNPTAMNNRLAWLEAHGFARSEWYGRSRLYRAVNTEKVNG